MFNNFSLINKELLGQTLTVGGFVHTIRDHGGLIFIDLRSQADLLQCVIDPKQNPSVFSIAESLHPEYVVKIKGQVIARLDETVNFNLPTGEVEISIQNLEIISVAKTLPFDIHAENNNLAGEDIRLKYRYLDLRREKLKSSFKLKHDLILAVRNWFSKRDFIEIQTPILANSTPEGARDFLIPSRLHPGKFYALPQAPQQYKQLLMVGGFNKYFQIAPCFRDEDPRSDRHPGDFYQIDAEIAWADEDYIHDFSKSLITEVFANFSEKKLADNDLQRISYFEAMDKYGSDKPDLRYDLHWQDAKEIFAGSDFKVFADLVDQPNARVQALVLKGVVDKFSRSDLDRIQAIGRDCGLPGIAYIQYFQDGPKSPIFKFLGDQKSLELEKFFKTQAGDLILFVANKKREVVWKAQDKIRKHLASKLDLIDNSVLKFVWVEDFPFFEKDEDSGQLDFMHNPFSLWKGGLEALVEAKKNNSLTDLKARQYDICCNGYEVLSGGVRNPFPSLLQSAFEIVGYKEKEIMEKFGHMMEAYTYGSPTHAGFAWGLDRLFMVLTGEENIREVIVFPKNGKAMEPMTGSPSAVNRKHLQDLGIQISD